MLLRALASYYIDLTTYGTTVQQKKFAGEIIGEFSSLDYLEEKTLANSRQRKYGYVKICKIEGENLGDLVINLSYSPMFSAIQYDNSLY